MNVRMVVTGEMDETTTGKVVSRLRETVFVVGIQLAREGLLRTKEDVDAYVRDATDEIDMALAGEPVERETANMVAEVIRKFNVGVQVLPAIGRQ